MNIVKIFVIAFRALAKNKMRASLTVLGVVIGIAAVTTMVSIGQSAGQLIQNEVASVGTNVIVIQPQFNRRRGVAKDKVNTLTSDDSDEIGLQCPSVLATSPLIGAGGQVVYGDSNVSPNEMFGVGSDFLLVRNWEIAHGGFFTPENIERGDRVVVIGRTIVKKLFQTTNPINEVIRISNQPFTVIGVLEEKGANMVGQDQDSVCLMPYTTVRRVLQGSDFNDVHAIMASARSANKVSQAVEEIRALLLERHGIAAGQPPDFQVVTMSEIGKMMELITGIMTMMLSAIAAISLVVGGVGIMNIMLVSVTERTREIGIRMAVGAKSGDILLQFLVEAMVLSCFGGLMGFLLGALASWGLIEVINVLLPGKDWPSTISFFTAGIAIIVSCAIGIVFGFFPAFRASRLDPIGALRYE